MDEHFFSNYIINNNGDIINRKTNKKLKPYLRCDGYLQVTLYDFAGNHKKFLVHRLVATKYIKNPLGLPQVNHKDMNKTNNKVENLEWVSSKDNLLHARKNGRNIYTKERNKKISITKTGVPRSEETIRKLSIFMRSLPKEKKVEMTHHLHKNRPSKSCTLCLLNSNSSSAEN